MAFHLHLIDSPCVCVAAGQLNFSPIAIDGSLRTGRPILVWARDADEQLAASWIMARD